MSARAVVALLLGAGLGCARGAAAPPDAAVDVGAQGPPVVGRRSFDVVAAISPAGGSPNVGTALPSTNAFTVVLDADAGRALVGGKGRATLVAATSADGRSFELGPFSVGVIGAACNGLSSIGYSSLRLTVDGASLRGSGQGEADVSCGDCSFTVAFSAELSGGDDVTPPVLFPASTSVPESPTDLFWVVASEPLPPTATAWLTFADGGRVALEAMLTGGDVPFVAGFAKPDVVLPFGEGIAVAVEGLVDFAGLRGSAATPLRLTAFDTPPLIPSDGFESATGPEVGGAALVSSGPLAPIAGAHSVYVFAPGAPAPPGVTSAPSLRVRLAVPPAATKLRFSFSTVTGENGGAFVGSLSLGSVGHAVARAAAFPPSGAVTRATWPDGITVLVSAAQPQEVALPADVTDEIFVGIDTGTVGCGLAAPPGGVLLDDLRVE